MENDLSADTIARHAESDARLDRQVRGLRPTISFLWKHLGERPETTVPPEFIQARSGD